MRKKSPIAAAYSAVAHTYDQAAFVEQQIGARLLERLDWIKLQPKTILDLGCGTGYFTQHLKTRYPQANIIGLDFAFPMLKIARSKMQLKHLICADAEQLPLAKQQFDLIFANCCLNPATNHQTFFSEIKRILTPDGLCLFATFGPDTLQELGLDNTWIDMHILGDLLLQQQFKNPVVDSEVLKFTYPSLQQLITDLQQSGSYIIDPQLLDNLNTPFTASFSVVYGHAWGQPNQQQFSAEGKTYIPISEIKLL